MLVSVGLAEAVLRAAEKARLGDRVLTDDLLKNDPELGLVLPPFTVGHDANGFRNDAVPLRADLVVLGDSQTWGVNATREDAWPKHLEKLTRRNVYNMGMGGFGVVQHWALTDKALALSPQTMIVGLYFGNDLYDAYKITYGSDRYKQLRGENLPADIGTDKIGVSARAFWDQEKTFYRTFGRATPSEWNDWVRGHTAIGRLLDRTGLWPGADDLQFKIGKAWAEAHPDAGAVYDGNGISTVFTTAYRKVGLDLSEPRVAEGMRITVELLPRIKEKTDAAGVHLLIVLIPTKETAYVDALRESRQPLNGTFESLLSNESQARAEILRLCEQKKLRCLDALPSLSAAIRRREQIYPTSTESHPNPRGYQVLAETVRDELKKSGW